MLTFFVLISVIGISFDSVKATSICRKPVTISDQYMGPSNRSFVIVGSNKKDGNGLGNKLVFFSGESKYII